MCSAKRHVRFTPNSDRESGFPQTVMSALPPKADMCGAARDVRIGPKADILACFLQLGPNGFLVAMLVDAQLRVDIRLLEAAIDNPCVRALDGAIDQRVGM
jgi:hypothetical protein